MSSFGDDLYAKTVHTTDVHSTGKIYWHDFSPPLTGSGISTLAAVLEAGNDANDQDIIGAGKIVMHDGDDPSTFVANSISGVTTLNCNLIVTGDGRAIEFGVLDDLSVGVDGASGGKILFNGTQGTNAITGASVANRVIVTNADLTDASNTFPASLEDDTLAVVMGRSPDGSASVGTKDLNMNSQQITNATSVGTVEAVIGTRISYASADGTLLQGSAKPDNPTVVSNMDFVSGSGNTFPSLSTDTLADVCARGNAMPADTALNMNSNAITSASAGTFSGTVTANALVGSLTVGTETVNTIVANLEGKSVAHAVLNFSGDATVGDKGAVTSVAVTVNTGSSSLFPTGATTFEAEGNSLYAGDGTGLFITLNTFPSGINDITSVAVSVAGSHYKSGETLTITQAQMRVIMGVPTLLQGSHVVLTLTAALGHTFITGDSALTNGLANLTECTYLDLSDSSNVGAVPTPHNPYQALMMYDPMTEGSKQWDEMAAAVFGTEIYLSYTPVGLRATPTVMVPIHFKCSFYVEDIDTNNVLAGLFRQTETSPGSNSWTPTFNPTDGVITFTAPATSGVIQHGYQYISHGANSIYHGGHVTIYGYITNLVPGVNYRFFPAIRTNTNTDPGVVTCKWGNRQASEPWSPVVVEINTVPINFKYV